MRCSRLEKGKYSLISIVTMGASPPLDPPGRGTVRGYMIYEKAKIDGEDITLSMGTEWAMEGD